MWIYTNKYVFISLLFRSSFYNVPINRWWRYVHLGGNICDVNHISWNFCHVYSCDAQANRAFKWISLHTSFPPPLEAVAHYAFTSWTNQGIGLQTQLNHGISITTLFFRHHFWVCRVGACQVIYINIQLKCAKLFWASPETDHQLLSRGRQTPCTPARACNSLKLPRIFDFGAA